MGVVEIMTDDTCNNGCKDELGNPENGAKNAVESHFEYKAGASYVLSLYE